VHHTALMTEGDARHNLSHYIQDIRSRTFYGAWMHLPKLNRFSIIDILSQVEIAEFHVNIVVPVAFDPSVYWHNFDKVFVPTAFHKQSADCFCFLWRLFLARFFIKGNMIYKLSGKNLIVSRSKYKAGLLFPSYCFGS
jgi:hypothetical protein